MSIQSLVEVAKAMVSGGRGLLAADESVGTENRRFAPLDIRRARLPLRRILGAQSEQVPRAPTS